MKLSRLLVPLLVLFVVIPCGLIAQVTVKGKITDSKTGDPVAMATVRVKNGNASTVTDNTGAFTIKAPSAESVISITHVGYQVYEVKAGDGNLTISMTATASDLNDVVVVGYGVQKKSHLTGSVGTVDMKNITD